MDDSQMIFSEQSETQTENTTITNKTNVMILDFIYCPELFITRMTGNICRDGIFTWTVDGI